jgi:tetraacyldisaccharide 4'-kinase
MRAPEFWRHGGLVPALLAPAACAFAAAGAARRGLARPFKAASPVLCVGNLVAGGAGKTPVAIAIARRLIAMGRTPHFLTRGYGGSTIGPFRVDPVRHESRIVGDEPLLLARIAPTWVARDRAAGARAAAAAGADAIVMDDGLQNPGLAKDLALVVVDGAYGFGNGRVIPAGPLREPLAEGLARADAVVIVGADETGIVRSVGGALPVVQARLVPVEWTDGIAGRDVVAFAGIARPEKFFTTLRELGCRLVAAESFADHHRYRVDEVMRLVNLAVAHDAVPVTTAKDAVRLPAPAMQLVRVLEIEIAWQSPEAIDALIAGALARTPRHG